MSRLKKILIILLIALLVIPVGCKKYNEEPVPDEDNGMQAHGFAMGVDLSYVNQIEDHGGIYLENGSRVDPSKVLKKHDTNTVRLRLWHNPDWVFDLYNNPVPL